MKKISSLFAALSLALTLAFGFAMITSIAPTPAHAEDAAVSDDATFVDGNWFLADGSVSPDLQTQIDKYDAAVEADNTADAEKYAIRSWVKANYAAELGRRAMVNGEYEIAKTHLERAVKLAQKAQKPGAGKGQKPERVDSNEAPKWGGTSAIEGARAEAYAKSLLNKVKKKLGVNG